MELICSFFYLHEDFWHSFLQILFFLFVISSSIAINSVKQQQLKILLFYVSMASSLDLLLFDWTSCGWTLFCKNICLNILNEDQKLNKITKFEKKNNFIYFFSTKTE